MSSGTTIIAPANAAQAPNTWLIGAPKCGTSSLFNWVASHPDVRATNPKETFALMDPENPMAQRSRWDRKNWLKFAEQYRIQAGGIVRLEGTTHHLYQRTAIEYVSAIPGSRVIVVLREPSDRIYSSFRFTKYTKRRVPEAVSFEEYLDALEAKRIGSLVRASSDEAFVLQREIEYSRYAPWIERWKKGVGRERLHIVLFEQLRADPRGELEKIALFLGIDGASFPDGRLKQKNLTVLTRFEGLREMATRLGRATPGIREWPLVRRIYHAVQRQEAPVSEADRAVRARLKQVFLDSNMLLAREFGLPIERWWNQ